MHECGNASNFLQRYKGAKKWIIEVIDVDVVVLKDKKHNEYLSENFEWTKRKDIALQFEKAAYVARGGSYKISYTRL